MYSISPHISHLTSHIAYPIPHNFYSHYCIPHTPYLTSHTSHHTHLQYSLTMNKHWIAANRKPYKMRPTTPKSP